MGEERGMERGGSPVRAWGGRAEIQALIPAQEECNASSQWPLLLWVAPESLSWMSLQLVWTLLPVATFGSCCSSTGKVKVGGSTRVSWSQLEGPGKCFWFFSAVATGSGLFVLFMACVFLVALFFIVCPNDKSGCKVFLFVC